METKIPLVNHGLDFKLRFFLEARLSGSYLLRQVLKPDTKLSKYKSIWAEEVSSLVFKNASNASCKSILTQSQLN